MDQAPFSRVKDLLRYARPATWTANLAGIGAGVSYVLLIVLLALAVDLIVTRGRIPNFAQLPVREQEDVLKEWAALSAADREAAVQQVGFAAFAKAPAKGEVLPPEEAARYRQYQSLVAGEGVALPPVPGNAAPEALREWEAKRGVTEDPYFAAAVENVVRGHLNDRHFYACSRSGDRFGSAVVDGEGKLGLRLCEIDGGERSRIYHEVGVENR